MPVNLIRGPGENMSKFLKRKEKMMKIRNKNKIVDVMNRLTNKKSLSPIHRVTKKDYWVENWISWICRKYERILK